MPGGAEPVEHRVREQRAELVGAGAHAEPCGGGVDVVEIATVDRGDEGERGVGERVEMCGGGVGNRRPAGFVSGRQRHDAQAGALAGVGRDVGEEGGSGHQLERRVQHERVPIADDLVARNTDDLGRGLDEALVVEGGEVAAVVLVDDLADADPLQRIRRREGQDA